ncbi:MULTISPECIES: GNAT family N-acetyltransferase [unclassified Sphingomonas]|uniref:GNAT family N-acetyltransferase n=1 Tax=unclassified Sphingomonas TaxID=196159 RepID=UPI0006F739F2|nr:MULTISPECIES: GNAT family N-acetyltransferase [unclassified Sphingomonas]KQN00284.1 hypothetical protein ASE78_03920 [Sphingomonas sp. Leaf25]
MPTEVRLRIVTVDDLPVFYEHQCDPMAAAMAGFVSRPRPAFDAHWQQILNRNDCEVRTVAVDGVTAGYVSTFIREGQREIAYWIGRRYWGQGVASRAVVAFLDMARERPVSASVVASNLRSIAVLRHAGFAWVETVARADGVVEQVFRLG